MQIVKDSELKLEFKLGNAPELDFDYLEHVSEITILHKQKIKHIAVSAHFMPVLTFTDLVILSGVEEAYPSTIRVVSYMLEYISTLLKAIPMRISRST